MDSLQTKLVSPAFIMVSLQTRLVSTAFIMDSLQTRLVSPAFSLDSNWMKMHEVDNTHLKTENDLKIIAFYVQYIGYLKAE